MPEPKPEFPEHLLPGDGFGILSSLTILTEFPRILEDLFLLVIIGGRFSSEIVSNPLTLSADS